MWLAVDLSKPEAADLVHNAATFIAEGDSAMSRLALLFNGGSDLEHGQTELLARFLVATMSLSSRVDKISPFVKTFSGDSDLWKLLAGGGQAALDAALAAAEEAGLNRIALQKVLADDGCCSALGIQVQLCSSPDRDCWS
jgi:hypothetical protein